jgi:DnaJ-class molecular chaperone
VDKADHYEALGVRRDATPEEVRSAYRREALRWHPDRNPGEKGAEERFRAASEAYEVLCDPDRRRAYDTELAGFGREPAFAPGAPHAGDGRVRGPGCGRGRGRCCAGGFGRGRRWRAWTAFSPPDSLVLNVDVGSLEAVFGCRKRIAVESALGTHVLDVQLPPGLADGDMVRLEGLGEEICLRVNIASAV